MRQQDTLSGLEKLHSIPYTFSIRNCMGLSGILTVQAICVFSCVNTKTELCRYGISIDSDCIYCGEPDYINHTFMDCEFTKTFTCNVINWFNTQHGSNFQPDTKEMLFATLKHPTYRKPVREFNYTPLFMKFYVYVSKLNNSSLVLTEFIARINYKYTVQNL